MESAHRELSNDTHIDYIFVKTKNFENMVKYRKIIDIWEYSQYGYRLKAIDELIPNMYILTGYRLKFRIVQSNMRILST